MIFLRFRSHLKANLVERKIRVAANTNNTEALSRLLESGVADVNVGDEHQRTALHFAAAKVTSCSTTIIANCTNIARSEEDFNKPIFHIMNRLFPSFYLCQSVT